MISRIRKSIELPAGDRRIAARMTLGFVTAILCLTLVLAGASMGLTGAIAFSQPSPSGSPSAPAEAKVFLLNPTTGYDAAPDAREDDPERDDVPKVSDKFDGVDEAFHIVAMASNPPQGAVVEAYWKEDDDTVSEFTIGEMSPVPGSPDTYELNWDIPETIDAFFGTLTVRMYRPTPSGFEEVSSHSEFVRLQQKQSGWVIPAEGPVPEAETVNLLWPTNGGPLGFHKGTGAGAVWRTWVNGSASLPAPAPDSQAPNRRPSFGANQVRVFYSKTPAGKAPQFIRCGQGGASAGGPNGARRFGASCALEAADTPSDVTAIAAVAMENQQQSGSGDVPPVYTQESSDVHRVHPYLQRVEEMKVGVTTSTTSDGGLRRHVVQGSSSSTCMAYMVTVTDVLDRPVQGANLDIHLRGPGDAPQFGDETPAARRSSTRQKPQKAHATEAGRDCDDVVNQGEQGDHNVPGGDDFKHVESATGTGVSGGAGVSGGQFLFHVWSPNVGDTEITAWVDDEPVASETEKREPDDDLLEETEPRGTNFVQWLPSAIGVTIDPTGATAAAGTCQRYIVRLRAGTRPIRGANVDVHATGPTNDLDFCDPGDASPRRAPDAGVGHNAEDEGEMIHAGEPPAAQHTEGVSNDQGNFVVGITSPVPGDTTLTAWYDAGEDGFDNDELGSEPSGTATTNWLNSTADAQISFVNPSPYGGSTATTGDGTRVARTQDVDSAFHVVARVGSLLPVDGVEFFVRTGSNPLVKIGDGTRVGDTDTYELYWPVTGVDDGSHTLVARIANTGVTVEQAITVNNNPPTAPDPRDVPFETAEITAPLDGQRASFTNRRLTVRGVASAGAEGIDLYYTKSSALATPGASAWTSCGFVPLAAGSAPKEFIGECSLQGGDQPGLVTGIAAITYDCTQSGCNATPGAVPGGGRNPGEEDSGDAHRVFGTEAAPSLSMEPAETAADVGECVKFVVALSDQTGQPIPAQNVDVHMTGPGNSGNFCAPEDGTGTPRRAPNDGAHIADANETDEAYHDDAGGRIQHTEAETTGNGRLIFAIESATAGDTQLTVWLDGNDNDVEDPGETSDVSVMHWEAESACDITGTDGPDVLEGSDASEKICGFGGDDVIRGGGGDDVIGGGAGNDLLRGNAGNDSVRGGAGNDRVFGGGGMDRAFGGGGSDVVGGHRSDDLLRGNRGNDRLNGGPGRDDCSGGGGRDQLRKCETGTRSFAARTRPI